MPTIQVSSPTYEQLTRLAREARQMPDALADQILRSLVKPATPPISAAAARRKVNHFVASEFSVLTGAGPAVLQWVRGRSVWRVSVVLTQPGRGRLGPIGDILVDRTSGELLLTETTMEEMRAQARSVV